MTRTVVRVCRAGVAGALLALGIGLGAYNAWWVALLAVPLIIGGFVVVPWHSRTSELQPFQPVLGEERVPVRVEALTRSSLAKEDLQPTLVTATISPPHDTAYQARWIASMSRREFRSLTDNPVVTLAPDRLPPREQERTPEFGDHPGKWTVIYPAITVLVALTVLFGVGDAWHISVDRPATPAPRADNGPTSKSLNLNARRDSMIREITAQFGPAAANNLLDLRFTGSGSDYGTVLNPTNGDTTIVYVNNSGDAFTTPSAQVLRKDSTFTAGDVAATDLTAITDKMAAQLDSAGRRSDLETLEIKRPRPGAVILTGTFGSKTVDALPDGTVGEIFDPADFAVSFQRARDALALAGFAPSDRVLTNFEIRGTHRATPTAHASELQSSGGVLLEFQKDDRSGQIVIVPGELPEVTDDGPHRSPSQTFAFDDISQEVFEAVRAQAMQRGALEPYEREAVEIWMTDREIDEHRLAIRIELAGVEAATGTYSVTGEFLAPAAI
ncbi:hypothetical protein [Mycolicibacterium wolinskyi]|uniref:hypothetical protein n=1 Tax=Mycolicibacterium wolinskyi TaxID=59750 RepID=UPI003917B47A